MNDKGMPALERDYSFVNPPRESWEGSYPDNWKRFRKTLLTFWILLALAFSGMAIGGIVESYLLPIRGIITVIIFIMLFTSLAAGIRVTAWKCPRCNKRCVSYPDWYLRGQWGPTMDQHKCMHCGLPKYAENEANP